VTTTAEAEQYGPSIVLRVLCHVLINCLPEEGLPELYENLAGLHEWYGSRRIHLVPETPIQKGIAVTVGHVLTSQPFDVAED